MYDQWEYLGGRYDHKNASLDVYNCTCRDVRICTCVYIWNRICTSFILPPLQYNMKGDKYIAVELLVVVYTPILFFFPYFTTPYGAHKWSALCISAVTDHCGLGYWTTAIYATFILTLDCTMYKCTYDETGINIYLFILIGTCHLFSTLLVCFSFLLTSQQLCLGDCFLVGVHTGCWDTTPEECACLLD